MLAQQLAQQPAQSAHGQPVQIANGQPAQTAHGQPGAQQQPQPGFTPAAGFKLPLQAPQRCKGLESDSLASHSCQPAAAETAPIPAPNQQAEHTQKGTADIKLHDATASDILGQQANLWRQAASKRSALADLVPASGKAAATHCLTTQGASAPAGGLPLMQPQAVQQGCAAFKPAVQACIAAAGLPLAKPFYQQAVEHAMEQHTQHRAVAVRQQPSSLDGVKQEALDAEALGHCVQEAAGNASPTADASRRGQHHVQQGMAHQQRQAAQRPASPTPSSDSDLGTDLPEEEAKRKARKHISIECWDSALIFGKLQCKQVAGRFAW